MLEIDKLTIIFRLVVFVVVCTLHNVRGAFDSGLELNFLGFSFRFPSGGTLDLLLEVVHLICLIK